MAGEGQELSESEDDGDLRVRSDRIIHLAYQQDLSLTELASRTGLSRETLSRKLHGKSEWKMREVIAIAQALDSRLSYLTNESDRPF